ncbi:MAG: tetratricopeptide repeat protein [Candidatus Izemoplasmatales bacterium]
MSDELLKKAIELFEDKEYLAAKSLFLSLENENAIAQYYLGAIYRMGLGVTDDQKEAFKWFLKAAEQGHAESQYLVGCAYTCSIFFMFNETDLVKNNFEQIESKANRDFSIWQDDLPYFDLNGRGVEPNDEEALKWIKLSADLGYVNAQVALGDLYDWGMGVKEDKKEAAKWYEKAAVNGNTIALRKMASLISFYDKDFQKSIDIYLKAYNLGDAQSAYWIGKEYERANNINLLNQEAYKWYKIAAEEANYFEAQEKLGDFYLEGKGVDIDIVQSIAWYKKSIKSFESTHIYGYLGSAYEKLYDLRKLGYENAITDDEMIEYLNEKAKYDDTARIELREFYHRGYDVGEKSKMMFKLLEKAENGNKNAQIEYGYLYIVNRNFDSSIRTKALDWFLEDASNGNKEAQFLLSFLYAGENYGQERMFWLRKAADQNHHQAQYELALNYKEDDSNEFINYMIKASESYIYAQIDLGYEYAHGDFVEINYQEAYKLYQKAASNMKNIKDIFEIRTINYVKFRYNAANDKAEELALQGDIFAQLYMGCLYQYGFEVKRNKGKAVFWYMMAKNQGSDEAKIQLEIIQKDFD